MRVYIDEDVNPRIQRFLPGHTFGTPKSMGFSGLSNGRLLAHLDLEFDVLITHDQNMQFQQNLANTRLRIIVLAIKGRHLSDYELLAPSIALAIDSAEPGTCSVVP